jgi:hypothetical protein
MCYVCCVAPYTAAIIYIVIHLSQKPVSVHLRLSGAKYLTLDKKKSFCAMGDTEIKARITRIERALWGSGRSGDTEQSVSQRLKKIESHVQSILDANEPLRVAVVTGTLTFTEMHDSNWQFHSCLRLQLKKFCPPLSSTWTR